MKFVTAIFTIGLATTSPATAAQVQYDTTQLDQRADVERNRILLHSTMQKKRQWDERAGRSTQAQASACASRARFRRQYGADNPKLQRLERLCAQAGY